MQLHASGAHNPFFGKHHTEETCEKLSIAKKGVPLSEETREKISNARKGVPLSEEHKRNIGAAKKGNTNVRGKRWFNNGQINVVAFECQPGFVPGRLSKKK